MHVSKAKTTYSASPTPPKARKRASLVARPSQKEAETLNRPTFPPPSRPISSHFLPLQRTTNTMLASPFHYQSQSQSQSQSQTPTSYFHHQTLEFLPKIPSPLSPRSANINGSASSSNGYRQQQPNLMSSENDASTKQPQSSFTFNAPALLPYSKRAIKRAPAVSQDALTERRRGMFLKKVREGREDRRFERHGEDVSIHFNPLMEAVLCKNE